MACAGFLAGVIAGAQPRMVVALGGVALAALGGIERHQLTLRTGVGRFAPWHGTVLTALYHPAARSTVHRRWEQQVADWRRLGEALTLEGNLRIPRKTRGGRLTPVHRISTMSS